MTKSRAFIQFKATLLRSIAVLEFSRNQTKIRNSPSKNSQVIDDLARAGVVLAVASMDAYYTNRFVEILVPYLRKKGASNGIIELLERAGFSTSVALKMITMERPFRRLRAFIETYLDTYTTQRFHVINDLFTCFGIKNLCENAQKFSNRKTLLRSIEILVSRRHSIVHNGDYNKYGKLIDMNQRNMVARIKDLVVLVTSSDEIISAFHKNL